MAAFGVDVQFGRDFRVFKREKIDSRVFDVDGIVFGLNDERWRSFFGRMNFRIGRHVLFGDGEIAGIDDDGEVGAAAQSVGGVDLS